MTTTYMRGVETIYRNFRFRSRLEARWAHFFTVLGVEWEYEPEGYEFDGKRYLPDFYLPSTRMFIEVKPRRGEEIDAKPRAIVEAGREMFGYDEGQGRQMVVVYGDPASFDADRLMWSAYSGVCDIRGGHPKVCPSCRSLRFMVSQPNVTQSGFMDCRCNDDRVLPTYQAFVADAALAARQARFEHGEQPETRARLEHRHHDAMPNIYLAGKIRGNDWRSAIAGDEACDGIPLDPGTRIRTKYRSWTFHGPNLRLDHGQLNHGVAVDCLRRVATSNTLFVWIDAANVHGTMAELGFFRGPGRGVIEAGYAFVTFASQDLLDEVWFAREMATAYAVVPTIEEAWDAFLEWEEYDRCYAERVP